MSTEKYATRMWDVNDPRRDQLIAAIVKHAKVTLACEPEDLIIEGNAMASGDDEIDREQEKWIHDQLDAGNEWAWCNVVVRVTYDGFHADDGLGSCSYLSEADFKRDGYFGDMVRTASARLADKLIAAGCVVDALLAKR